MRASAVGLIGLMNVLRMSGLSLDENHENIGERCPLSDIDRCPLSDIGIPVTGRLIRTADLIPDLGCPLRDIGVLMTGLSTRTIDLIGGLFLLKLEGRMSKRVLGRSGVAPFSVRMFSTLRDRPRLFFDLFSNDIYGKSTLCTGPADIISMPSCILRLNIGALFLRFSFLSSIFSFADS